MANINIAGTTPVEDPEYRYKMPRIMGKVEGRGNGIKTAVVNMTDLGMALHRDPGEITKFFGTELGAQTKWTPDNEKSIVNGAHTDATLQALVFKYCELFVLCPNCRLPESEYKIKNGIIYHKCAACGSKDAVDMSHRLCTFILNNTKKEKDKGKKDKKKDKKDKKSKEDGEEGGAATDVKKEKDKKHKKKDKDKDKKKKAGSSEDDEGSENKDNGSDDDFGEGEEEDIVATLDNLEVDDASALDDTVSAIKRHLEANIPVPSLMEELRTAQTFSAFPVHYRTYIYVLAAFDTATKVTEADIASKAPVFTALKTTKDDQRHIIGAFELLCAARRPNLAPFFPLILKFLYDADIVEEEAMLLWAGQEGRSEYTAPAVTADMVAQLRDKAQPFITWLEEADEESDEEGEDED